MSAHGRPRGVAAEALELLAVRSVDAHLRVHIDPAQLGGRCARRGHEPDGANELSVREPASAPSSCTSAADAPYTLAIEAQTDQS